MGISINELRIGNYVSEEILGMGKVSEIHKYALLIEADSLDSKGAECKTTFTINYQHIKPIPLTEEWLLKFGFKRYENGDANLGRCYSSPNVSLLMWYGQDRADVSFWQGDGFKYVNQLQNIYFALTNKELTL